MGVNELASDNVERDSKVATAPLAGAGQSPAKVKKTGNITLYRLIFL